MNKQTKRFEHDCDNCVFLGHFYDHDVYICPSEISSSKRGGSILARFGNEGREYASQPLYMLENEINREGGELMDSNMMEVPYYKAWLTALAAEAIRIRKFLS